MYRGRLASGRLPTELPSGATGGAGSPSGCSASSFSARGRGTGVWRGGGVVRGAWYYAACRCAAWRGFRLVGCGVAFGLHGAFGGLGISQR
ncbi:MAG TPA: hypothetical protein ENF26_06425 [Methanomicrobia archaeon]|nr:hypothetical protein [Methanomicrobia archaeon]HEX59763.1 hypothetical protein [Methanomicrobia archaeon]